MRPFTPASLGIGFGSLFILTATAFGLQDGKAAPAAAPGKIDFQRDVRPILSQHCFQCHGPDDAARKGKLRLDRRDDAFAERKEKHVISPGNLEDSLVWGRITTDNEKKKMPPEGKAEPLSEKQIDILKKWIEQGADWKEHWAFVNPVKPAVPEVNNKNWVKDPIDAFILARLEKEGLKPEAEATKEAWLRRASFDLTGLPPTPAEIDIFLKDSSPNSYEKQADRLLASTRFGERQAQEWLDLARYADSNGYQNDTGRKAWKWREWVINAYNANMPFDQFTIEQLAGDLLPNATLDQKVATGFNRNHPVNSEAGAEEDEYRSAYVIDRVNTTSTVFMGLTLACVQCHDHKYDPLTQKDYYSFFAFFNNIKERDSDARNPRPSIPVPNPDQEPKLKDIQKRVKALEDRLKQDDPVADAAQAEWEKQILTNIGGDIAWTTLEPSGLLSRNGSALKRLPDGSILSTGPAPVRDVYDIVLQPGKRKISALRIEVLPDESMPEKGNGRSSEGYFIVSAIELRNSTLSESQEPPLVYISAADSDVHQKVKEEFTGYSMQPGPIEGAIVTEPVSAQDGGGGFGGGRGRGFGWSIVDDARLEAHEAVLVPLEPLELNDASVLRLSLHQTSAMKFKSLVGRFRISMTDDDRIRKILMPAQGKLWSSVGPFAAEDMNKAYETAFEPEKDLTKGALDLKKSYEKPVVASADGPKGGGPGGMKPEGGKPGAGKPENNNNPEAPKANINKADANKSADGKTDVTKNDLPKVDAGPNAAAAEVAKVEVNVAEPEASLAKPDGDVTKPDADVAKHDPVEMPKGESIDAGEKPASMPKGGKFEGDGKGEKPFGKFKKPGAAGAPPAVAAAAPQDGPKKGNITNPEAKADEKSGEKSIVKKDEKPEKGDKAAKNEPGDEKKVADASKPEEAKKKPEKITWTEQPKWRDGNAGMVAGGNNSAFYFTRKIVSTRPRTAMIKIEGPSGYKVWLNGEPVYNNAPQPAPAAPGMTGAMGAPGVVMAGNAAVPTAAPAAGAEVKDKEKDKDKDKKDATKKDDKKKDEDDDSGPAFNLDDFDFTTGRMRGQKEDPKFRIGLREGENEIVVKAVFAAGGGRGQGMGGFFGMMMMGAEPSMMMGRQGGGGSFTFELTPEGEDLVNHEVALAIRAAAAEAAASKPASAPAAAATEPPASQPAVASNASARTTPVATNNSSPLASIDEPQNITKTAGEKDNKVSLVGEKSAPLYTREETVKLTPAEKRKAVIREFYRSNIDPIGRVIAAELLKAKEEERLFKREIPETLVMEEREKPRQAYIYKRGLYKNKGENVSMNTPAVLPPMHADLPKNRLGLAKWIVSPEHPLTARVVVNRIWQQYFGTGIVRSAEDFGIRCETPSHAELLDYLATEFREGWDIKKLHKRIVLSAAYRQSSNITKEKLEADPENRLLSRGPRLRLSAEMIRDNALAASGLLVEKIGGESVKPYQPKNAWKTVEGNPDSTYRRDKDDKQYRRGVYVYWKRGSPFPSMLNFDASKRENCTMTRAYTTTPLQALTLMNDPVYVEAAKMLGQRMLKDKEVGREKDDTKRLIYGFRLCTSRAPSEQELEILKKHLAAQREHYKSDVEAAKKLLSAGDAKVDEKIDDAEAAAWATVGSVLLNLDSTIHRG